jgi:hypothetical protein
MGPCVTARTHAQHCGVLHGVHLLLLLLLLLLLFIIIIISVSVIGLVAVGSAHK